MKDHGLDILLLKRKGLGLFPAPLAPELLCREVGERQGERQGETRGETRETRQWERRGEERKGGRGEGMGRR